MPNPYQDALNPIPAVMIGVAISANEGSVSVAGLAEGGDSTDTTPTGTINDVGNLSTLVVMRVHGNDQFFCSGGSTGLIGAPL